MTTDINNVCSAQCGQTPSTILAFYVLNCGVYQLQKMTERMKQLKNENSNS